MTNEPKPQNQMADNQMADDLTMDAPVEAAMRERDRIRPPEPWASVPVAGSSDVVETAPAETDAAAKVAEPAPPAPALGDEAGAVLNGRADDDDGGDDDLFAPEPTAAVEPDVAERRWFDQPPVTEESAFDADSVVQPAAEDAVGSGTMDAAPAGSDAAADPQFASAEEPRPSALPDFDSSSAAEATGPDDVAPVAKVRLPPARNLLPAFAEATVPGSAGEPVPPPAADIAPAPDPEPPSLPGRMFGLKRALDAHRLGVSMEGIPAPPAAEPEPEPKPERRGWFGSWRAAAPESAAAEAAAAALVPSKPEPEFQPERKSEPEPRPEPAQPAAGPAAAVGAVAIAAAAMPKAERKEWFGNEIKSAEPELVSPPVASTIVEPEPKAERKSWFGSRRTPGTAADVTEPKDEPAKIEAKASPDAAEAKPDSLALTATAIAAKATVPAPAQIDLEPVREAMQAAALKRSDAAEDRVALPAAAAGTSGEAPAARLPDTGRVGVLLVNLGTPDALKVKAVRRYLREFLSDKRVIERDTFVWQLVFRGIILPFRPRSKARAYKAIWNQEKNESPLKTVTRSQAEKLGEALADAGSDAVVDWAMRYGNPSIGSRMKALIAQGCERILLMPLYPQYSSATTATVCDEAFRVLTRIRNQPSLRVAPPYYADPTYIDAVASSIRAELAKLSFEPDVILASFHGMPLEYVQKGDPYYRQCVRTTELLRERLGVSQSNFMMTFQSRFGRAAWLQPYTDQTLRELAKSGVKNVAVVTPGFAADCLETLEEIAIENARVFKKKGGKNFAFIPCLNDSDRGMRVIRAIATRELNGWV